MSKNILCIGEALIDFVCSDIGYDNLEGEVYFKKAGGAPANVSACIGRLGGKAKFLGAVGNDVFGDYLVDTLRKFNVDVSGIQRTDISTSLAFVTLMKNAEREFVFNRGADAEFELTLQNRQTPLLNNICHFGSATAFLEGKLQDSYFSFAEQCIEDKGVVCFDPNYRIDLWSARLDTFRLKCERFFKLAHIVKVSEEELELLTGEKDLVLGCKVIHDYGVKTIFVTLGAKGCFLSTPGMAQIIPAFKVNAIDTTGAGDAFVGGALFKISSMQNVHSMEYSKLVEVVRFAQKVSAYVCEKVGAMTALPTELEVDKRTLNSLL